MKHVFLPFLVLVCSFAASVAQPTYLSANYAGTTDVFNISRATSLLDFDVTGANITWDYSTLVPVSQRKLNFKDPKNTGFSQAQWGYIFNANNVNLASTDSQTVDISGVTIANANDYYLNSASALAQKASSFKVTVSGLPVDIRNEFSSPDIIYSFPLTFGKNYSSNSAYTTSFPFLYYIAQTLNRTSTVDGWGTVKTPYGTFTNCLKVVSIVHQEDTVSFGGTGIPRVINDYREYKWLDPSMKYPVLTVRQSKVGDIYITQYADYIDQVRAFGPNAFFGYNPVLPAVNEPVTFLNLSTNTTSYIWDFGDGSATSTDVSPSHAYATDGIFQAQLIAFNDALESDTFVLPVRVGSTAPVQLVFFNGSRYNGTNNLAWQVASGSTDAYFLLERSITGNVFTQIATITSKSNSSAAANYAFTDKSPLAGNNIYRLKMVEKDGKASYSGTVLLRGTAKTNTLTLLPNIVSSGAAATLAIQSGSKTNATVSIYNAVGKLMRQQAVALNDGQTMLSLATQNLSKGLYYIQCQAANGHTFGSQKLIIP